MTDNEIIKGLACCKKRVDADCENCPYAPSDRCVTELFNDIFDLLNRQKEEIERLQAKAKRKEMEDEK